MSVDESQVMRDAGAGEADREIVEEVLAEANAYVGQYVASNALADFGGVPDEILDAATLACAVDLFTGRKAPYGQQISADGTAGVTRVAGDPMVRARLKLAPWCVSAGFAFPADWDDTDTGSDE